MAPGSREAAPDAGTVPAPAGAALGRLIESARPKGRTLDGQERPAAIVWTDPGRAWQPLLESLRERLPELLVLDDYPGFLSKGD